MAFDFIAHPSLPTSPRKAKNDAETVFLCENCVFGGQAPRDLAEWRQFSEKNTVSPPISEGNSRRTPHTMKNIRHILIRAVMAPKSASLLPPISKEPGETEKLFRARATAIARARGWQVVDVKESTVYCLIFLVVPKGSQEQTEKHTMTIHVCCEDGNNESIQRDAGESITEFETRVLRGIVYAGNVFLKAVRYSQTISCWVCVKCSDYSGS